MKNIRRNVVKIKIVLATINNVIGYRLLVVLAPGNQEDLCTL